MYIAPVNLITQANYINSSFLSNKQKKEVTENKTLLPEANKTDIKMAEMAGAIKQAENVTNNDGASLISKIKAKDMVTTFNDLILRGKVDLTDFIFQKKGVKAKDGSQVTFNVLKRCGKVYTRAEIKPVNGDKVYIVEEHTYSADKITNAYNKANYIEPDSEKVA